MLKATIPNTDLHVTRLCYGTNMLGDSIDQAGSEALLDRFVALGGTFIDSARAYGAYHSEKTIGTWLKSREPSDLVIATKGIWKDKDFNSRFTAAELDSDLNASLQDLGVDTIDLYWLHTDDDTRPFEPIMDALIRHKKAGHIRWFGASNWSPERIFAANAYAASQGSEGFIAIQPMWGLARPNRPEAMVAGYGIHYEEGLQPVHEAGLAMIPYTSQSFGFFATLDAKGEAGLSDFQRRMFLNDQNRKRMKAVQRIAASRGEDAATIALAYLLEQSLPTFPIIGTSRPDQLNASVRADIVKLTSDELSDLRSA